ncbi:MAG: hypothetical protein GFH25_541266n58, partial [Chloroflexi bacterium AL-N10]|nr:hypothetical protein [Chloroflexi bacterium AL-N10]
RELILSKNELDQKLYNYAVKLNKKLISQIDDYELAVFSTRLARNISKIKQGLKRRLTILN